MAPFLLYQGEIVQPIEALRISRREWNLNRMSCSKTMQKNDAPYGTYEDLSHLYICPTTISVMDHWTDESSAKSNAQRFYNRI